MITIGCLKAEVFENDSGETIGIPDADVRMTYCPTSETEGDTLIVTPQMRQLGNAGYLPIAIARVQRDDVNQFRLFAVSGLSESLRSALEHQGCDVIQNALSGLDGQNIPPVSN